METSAPYTCSYFLVGFEEWTNRCFFSPFPCERVWEAWEMPDFGRWCWSVVNCTMKTFKPGENYEHIIGRKIRDKHRRTSKALESWWELRRKWHQQLGLSWNDVNKFFLSFKFLTNKFCIAFFKHFSKKKLFMTSLVIPSPKCAGRYGEK